MKFHYHPDVRVSPILEADDLVRLTRDEAGPVRDRTGWGMG